MQEFTKIRTLYKLKSVYRYNSQENRKESVAEHTWSALMLADYILSKFSMKIDRLKVYELLMYHDIVEIETGDIPIHHEEKRKSKVENERKALKILKQKLPNEIAQKLEKLHEEFEESSAPEAKFARAIDKLDATIHELDYKDDWKGWDEAMLRKYHEKHMKEFPETQNIFEELVKLVKKKKYFQR